MEREEINEQLDRLADSVASYLLDGDEELSTLTEHIFEAENGRKPRYGQFEVDEDEESRFYELQYTVLCNILARTMARGRAFGGRR